MTLQEKLNLVTNYFAEDWAIDKAMQLLEDYENAQQPAPSAAAPMAPILTDDQIEKVYSLMNRRLFEGKKPCYAEVRVMLAAPQPSPTPQADSQPAPTELHKFYGVTTDADLIAARKQEASHD